MTTKEKLAAIKKKITDNAPIIIASTSTVVTIATVVYYKTKMTLETSKEDLEAMQTGNVNVTYSIDGGDYTLRYVGNTPKN